ncbi:MAG: RNase adapter RapZ [Thermoanaerobaculia bacterium]|nr:RNase adapter RapZ [Thermoanaerobaculia bacterium]
MAGVRLVLVTGLSGSGKSTVANCFEDLAYYCVDNLPLSLLRELLRDPRDHVSGNAPIAVVTDVRAPGFAAKFPQIVAGIDRTRVDASLLFLEASDDVLVRRFSETRRPHPLAADRPPLDAIQEERRLLAGLRAAADRVIDTSDLSIHELRQSIFEDYAQGERAVRGPMVFLESFGFKHGIPKGADLLFDTRFLPNPYFRPELRELSGRDAPVVEFLEGQEEFVELARRIEELLLYLRPRFERDNRAYLTVAIGCTGGRHRSVAMVERLRERFARQEWPVRVNHRDVER